MYHVLEMFSRLIAPILSFTADEIWQSIPGERAASVFLSDFSESVAEFSESESFSDEFWQKVMAVKTAVNKELEAKRAAKKLGSSLSAEVDLYCNEDLANLLARFEEELRFVLIVSRASIHSIDSAAGSAVETEVEGLKLLISPSIFAKCERCWHHLPNVGESPTHPSLCQRCVVNIDGEGEQRSFA